MHAFIFQCMYSYKLRELQFTNRSYVMIFFKKMIYIIIFIFPGFMSYSMEDKKQELSMDQESLSKLSGERKDLTENQILHMLEGIKDMPKSDLLKLFATEFPKMAMEILESNKEILSRFGPYDPEKNFGYDYHRYIRESNGKENVKMDYGIGIKPDEGINLEDTLYLEQRRLTT